MIVLSEEQKKLIEPIVDNLEDYLINDKAEDLVAAISFYFCDLPDDNDYIYTEKERKIEDVMDYINSKYSCKKYH